MDELIHEKNESDLEKKKAKDAFVEREENLIKEGEDICQIAVKRK